MNATFKVMKAFLDRLIVAVVCSALVIDPSFASLLVPSPAQSLTISSRFASITDQWSPPIKTAKDFSYPTVVLVQDLHSNVGVQSNIAEIIKSLSQLSNREKMPFVVFVEGAYGAFDASALRQISNPTLKHDLVSQLLNEHKLTGAEVAAAESQQPLHLWGIDDRNLYLRNLQVFSTAADKSSVPLPKNPIWSSYYSVAEQRNIPLSLNAIAHIDLLRQTASRPKRVVLVAGGYHTKGISRVLQANRISYVVVTPMVQELGNERVHTQILRELALEARSNTLSRILLLSLRPFISGAHEKFVAEIELRKTQMPQQTSLKNGLGFWIYYSGVKHLYEYSSALVARAFGFGTQVTVTPAEGYVHLFQTSIAISSRLHRARDAIITASGPLVSLLTVGALAGLVISTHNQSSVLHTASLIGLGILGVPSIVLFSNLLAFQDVNSRGYRFLRDLGIVSDLGIDLDEGQLNTVLGNRGQAPVPQPHVFYLGPLQFQTSLPISVKPTRGSDGVFNVSITRTDEPQLTLSIEEVPVGVEAYLKIGQRTYRVIGGQNKIDLDAMLNDGLLWMGNRQLVDFYTPYRVFRAPPGPKPSLEPFPAHPRLQPLLVPSEIAESERAGMIARLRGMIPTLIIEDETGTTILKPHERMKLLHYAAVAGAQPSLSSGHIDESAKSEDEYALAMEAIRTLLGDPATRYHRIDESTERLAIRLADYLTMVHYGFDEIREHDLAKHFDSLLKSGDPAKLRAANWYMNQPAIPGKGKAIQITPLPVSEQVPLTPIQSINELQKLTIVHESSLDHLVEGMGDSFLDHVVAVLPAAGAASRFGGVPKANYKVVKIVPHAGGEPVYLSFMQVKRAMVSGLSTRIPQWATASYVSNPMVRGIFNTHGPNDIIITQEVSRRLRRGTVDPLQFDNGQLSLAPGVGHASNITQILLNKELMIQALREGKYFFSIGNIDNLGQRIRPSLIKTMLKSVLEGKPITAIGEITKKWPGDAGGIPALVTYMQGFKKVVEIDLREQPEFTGIPIENPQHVNEADHFYFNPANYNVYFPALLVLIDVLSANELSKKPDELARLAIHRLEGISQEALVTRYHKLIKNAPTYIISRKADDPVHPGETIDADQFEQMMQNYLFRLLPGHKLFAIGQREGAENSFTPVKAPAETSRRQQEFADILNGSPVDINGVPLREFGEVVPMPQQEIEEINKAHSMLDFAKNVQIKVAVEMIAQRLHVETSDQNRAELLAELQRMMFDENNIAVRDLARFAMGIYLGVNVQKMLEWDSQASDVVSIIRNEEDRERKAFLISIVRSVVDRETQATKSTLLRSAKYVVQQLNLEGNDAEGVSSNQNSILGNSGWFSYWATYSGMKMLYEYISAGMAALTGITNVHVHISRTSSFIWHPAFHPDAVQSPLDHFSDILIALSGPVASLLVGGFLIQSFVAPIFGLNPVLPQIRNLSSFHGMIVSGLLAGIWGIPAVVLGLGNLTSRNPASRLSRILNNFRTSNKSGEVELVSEAA